jgi:NAD(P)-dependent dehydrogenase (short-subunit alcohol dehydrogenase family)
MYDKSHDPAWVGMRKILATNVVGPMLVTEMFLDLLRKSSSPRIVFVSSSGSSLTHAADPKSPYYGSKTGMKSSAYRASKASLNMMLIQYDKELREEGFKVMGADPGLVVTNFLDAALVKSLGAPGADVGGRTVAEVVKGERDADLGRVVGRYGVSPW